ncbi:hypothetical protein P7228_05810 [Altererythrobacter arenosus]|uniref:PAS domain-containing protein n=1 Tax=Altererythrobacter arenosus TaxID=3032592 RepID=A0ABY8FUA1_9SPHN|nr:hypothetical protein [Altererythrobacter sp. CAU 1644]WFL78579.1 hypothetical protein P7228_05810 [Altererythrobacter sp. CAU 1644]
MDTLRGAFGSSDVTDDSADYDLTEEENIGDAPPASIGSDERRMQVRAYNHWAGLLGERNFPSIEDLDPTDLPDFGPYSVLLDFSTGIEDPAVQYLGDMLAAECGAGDEIRKLSDVPPRSLLSRITDHYLQILANQAPIGFEAEFVNQRGSTILYRGILLPFSSDDDTIDFIYGVINWKEMADAVTADELLLEIDQALEADELEEEESEPVARASDPVTDWADGPGAENELTDGGMDDIAPLELGEEDEVDYAADLPEPAFGDYALDDYGDEEDEEEDEANYDFASLTDHIRAPVKKSEPIDLNGVEAFAMPSEYSPDSDDEDFDLEAPAPFEPQTYEAEASYDESAYGPTDDIVEDEAVATEDVPAIDTPDVAVEETPVSPAPVESDFAAPTEEVEIDDELPEDAGLYDCLASARELAQTARSCEDRSRSALYAAVGRAYDFSLAAQAEPQEYDELVAESGLTVQDRAPMTPVVKLVFGADYDKTRLTEYAAVLSHAHRVGIERGKLAGYLSEAEGGLKGVVTSERRFRKEEAGKPVEPENEPRAALAKKLRKLDHFGLEDLSAEGPEFAIVMIRRTENGQIAVLGEIDDDVPLIERVGRKLVG